MIFIRKFGRKSTLPEDVEPFRRDPLHQHVDIPEHLILLPLGIQQEPHLDPTFVRYQSDRIALLHL